MTLVQAYEWTEFMGDDDGRDVSADDPDDPPARAIKVKTAEEFEAAVIALRRGEKAS